MRRNTKGAWFGGGEIFLFIAGLGLGMGGAVRQDQNSAGQKFPINETSATKAPIESGSPALSVAAPMAASPSAGQSERMSGAMASATLESRLAAMSLGELRVTLEDKEMKFDKVLQGMFSPAHPKRSFWDQASGEGFEGDPRPLEGVMEFTIDDKLIVLHLKKPKTPAIEPKMEEGKVTEGQSIYLWDMTYPRFTIHELGPGKSVIEGDPEVKGIISAKPEVRDGRIWYVAAFSHRRLDDFGHAVMFEAPRADETARFEVVLDENAKQIKSGLVRWRLLETSETVDE